MSGDVGRRGLGGACVFESPGDKSACPFVVASLRRLYLMKLTSVERDAVVGGCSGRLCSPKRQSLSSTTGRRQGCRLKAVVKTEPSSFSTRQRSDFFPDDQTCCHCLKGQKGQKRHMTLVPHASPHWHIELLNRVSLHRYLGRLEPYQVTDKTWYP
jgi:hypothetical protein